MENLLADSPLIYRVLFLDFHIVFTTEANAYAFISLDSSLIFLYYADT